IGLASQAVANPHCPRVLADTSSHILPEFGLELALHQFVEEDSGNVFGSLAQQRHGGCGCTRNDSGPLTRPSLEVDHVEPSEGLELVCHACVDRGTIG